MGYSINDRVEVGKFVFDLQVEVVGSRVVGEILSNGRVLKKLVLPLNGQNEKEAVSEVFSQLKQLLLSRVKEKATQKAVSLKERLAEFFEVEENQVMGFLLSLPGLEEPVKCMRGELTPSLEKWLSSVEEFSLKFPRYRPEVLTVTLDFSGEKVLAILVDDREEGVKVACAFSGVRLSLIRKKLNRGTLKEVIRSVIKS